MKKIFLTLILVSACSLSAMTPAPDSALAAITTAVPKYKNLAGKALLDGIEKDVNLDPAQLSSLLQAFEARNDKLGIDLIARAMINNEVNLDQFMALPGLDHAKKALARFYFMLKKEDLAGVDEDSYGFSIQDYLDYQPRIIAKRVMDTTANLSSLKIDTLDGLDKLPNYQQLQELDLSNNSISVIPANAWQGLGQLRWLYLSHNELRTIPANAWKGLEQLEDLGLSDNQIKSISPNAWRPLGNLKKLNLSDNPLSDADKQRIKSELPSVKISLD